MKSTNLTIKDWDVTDRPREKMLQQGAEVLTNAELLAILIGSGSTNENAVGLMQRILKSVDHNLHELRKMPMETLLNFKGIGAAKAIKLKTAMELAKRMQFQKSENIKNISSSKMAFEIIHANLAHLPYEEFWILFLNQSNRFIEKKRLSKGGISETTVDIRLALKRALEVSATGIILVHNHPSGNLKPSKSDKKVTEKFKVAARYFDLVILDHLIVSEKGYFSFADEKMI